MSEPTQLFGLFFHTFKDGKVQLQGRIIGHPHPEHVLVQYFEWMMGEPSTIELVPISVVANGATINCRHTNGTWQLYRSAEQMNAWYEDHHS